jgi:hypothetical protein
MLPGNQRNSLTLDAAWEVNIFKSVGVVPADTGDQLPVHLTVEQTNEGIALLVGKGIVGLSFEDRLTLAESMRLMSWGIMPSDSHDAML